MRSDVKLNLYMPEFCPLLYSKSFWHTLKGEPSLSSLIQGRPRKILLVQKNLDKTFQTNSLLKNSGTVLWLQLYHK